jgi:hypothetical protein
MSTGPATGDGNTVRATRRALLEAVAAGAAGLALGGLPAPVAARQAPATPVPAGPPAEVRIYPAADTLTASPQTEISFRGITREAIGSVSVVASTSGGHSGILADHADGNGVSYLPDAYFIPGEVVTVRASGLAGTAHGEHRFSVVRPVPWVQTPMSREVGEPEAPPHAYRSRPDLRPPVLEITHAAGETAPGHVFLGAQVRNGQNGALIVDNDGQPVWFGLPAESTSLVKEVRIQTWQGQPVLTWSEGSTPIGFGLGHYVICDTSYQRVAELQVGNGFAGGDFHEFLITSRDTALIGLYHAVEWDLTPVGGSRYGLVIDNIVQELEIGTGRVLFEWHTLDHIAVDETRAAFEVGEYRDHPFDYFHLNSIEEDADGNLIISARHTFAIYKLDRGTGAVIWRLNGERSDFAVDEDAAFAWQHDARVLPSGELSLFDNHEANSQLEGEAWSRGLVLTLDETAMTASVAREYIHAEKVLATSQANMQTLPNGNVFIGWGSAPDFSEFTPDGEMIFNGRFPEGGNSYRAYRFPWSAQPAEPPDAVAETGADGTVTVYASWNGSTDVASWRVLAGPDPSDLAEVAGGPRSGFETAIEVATSAPWLAVEALDAGGAILGASAAIQARPA